jgi:hypothetical protein
LIWGNRWGTQNLKTQGTERNSAENAEQVVADVLRTSQRALRASSAISAIGFVISESDC